MAPECSDISRFQEGIWPEAEDLESERNQQHHAREVQPSAVAPRVFIVSSVEQLEVAEAAQYNLDHEFEPHLWTQGFKPGGTTATAVATECQNSDFAVIVIGPDDVVRSRGKEDFIPRDNVILEIGVAAGILGFNRTFLVKPRGVPILPTDLDGILPVDYDERRAEKLAALGSATTLIKETMRSLGRRSR